MSAPTSPIRDCLASALTGSIVTQRLIANGADPATVTSRLTPEQVRSWAREIDAIGIDPDLLAEHTITCLVLFLAEINNQRKIRSYFADVLWRILGDPESGDPPEIYRKAALGIWYCILITLDPSFQKANG